MKYKNISIIVTILLFILILPSISYSYILMDEESEKILTSKELDIKLVSSSGVEIDNINRPLSWISADFNNYPKNTYRQEIISKNFNIESTRINSTNIYFKEKKVSDDWHIDQTYSINTKNQYFPVKNKVDFPLKNVDKKFKEYTKTTKKIDSNDEIISTASAVASGKDDLFEVSQSIADWVTTNIQYDLSTITEDDTQKASWVMNNRKGVCDELSILFVAMMRSIGVPARMVSGISYTNSNLFSKNWLPHSWAEVYFPDNGWVPFDLTYKQFGFIDASHITFLQSHNSKTMSSRYLWKGYDIDKIDFKIIPTTYDIEVKDYKGTIDQNIDISANLFKNALSPGSYNIMNITLQNNQDYYLSSMLYISHPPEIKINDKNNMPVFVKPNSKKSYYIMIEVTSDLSSNYIYEIPIYIRTFSGSEDSVKFKVGNEYPYISINEINSFLSEYDEDDKNSTIEMVCNLDENKLYVDENTKLICIIRNTGNTYFKNNEICVNGDFDFEKSCKNFTLPISKSHTFTTKLSSSSVSNKNLNINLETPENTYKEKLSILIHNKPKIKVSNIEIDEIEQYGDDININVSLKKKGAAVPRNVDVRVIINDKIFNWKIKNFTENTIYNIPMNSYNLKEGNNTIKAFIIWEDKNGAQYHTEKTTDYKIDDIGFIKSLKGYIYRLLSF
ncbi:MAG: transglutaminase-like domain-containing protein [Nanobdellota archaeon]